jgi:DivIVA domain-containing protein
METKTHSPSFTVSLRGYDREEVDHYIDSLAEALEQVDDSSEQNRHLQSTVNRLNGRIKELEDRINSEAPRSGAVVGERIGILLREAEEAASDTVTRAETRAAAIVAAAEAKEHEADDIVRAALARGEDQSRRIESAARAEAAEIVAEAEARATARTRQIEQWAEQVISHTRAEEARMLREQQERRKAAKAELQFLSDQQDEASRVLTDLRDALGQALGLIEPVSPAHQEEAEERFGDAEGDERADAAAPAEAAAPAGAEARGTDAGLMEPQTEFEEAPRTGEVPIVIIDTAVAGEDEGETESDAEPDQEGPGGSERDFETKLESWVSTSSEAQRRW